jgi:hypothetical protein
MKNTIIWLSRATRWAALTIIALPLLFSSCTEEEKPNNSPKVGNLTIEIDHDWGMDHGTWSILKWIFPDANIPVLQISIDGTNWVLEHYSPIAVSSRLLSIVHDS